jgi:hypothetical protein
MSRLTEKPDLLAWATSLQKLISEGSAPRALPGAHKVSKTPLRSRPRRSASRPNRSTP